MQRRATSFASKLSSCPCYITNYLVITQDDNEDNLTEDGTKEHRANYNREFEHGDVDKNINSVVSVDQRSIYSYQGSTTGGI